MVEYTSFIIRAFWAVIVLLPKISLKFRHKIVPDTVLLR